MRAAIAVIVVALAATVWFLVDQAPPTANTALVDTATTNQVEAQVKTAIEDSFSYDYTDTARTEKAARAVLVGEAMRQYEQLFGQVRRQAAEQKLVLVSSVRSIAVRELAGDDATLLVFVDQQAVRTGSNGNTSTSAQLRVLAHRSGAAWRVTGLTVL
jgi:Mce-associated membrane protein